MKTFKKECKHAEFERNYKQFYSEEEAADGCWKCGKDLVPSDKPKHDNLDHVSMDEASKQRYKDHPEEMEKTLAWLNRAEYYCPDCWNAYINSIKTEECIPIETLIEEAKDGTWERKRAENKKEVEECGPDCVYWDRYFGKGDVVDLG